MKGASPLTERQSRFQKKVNPLTERPSRFQKKVNPMLKTTGKHRCVAGVVALVVVVLMLGVPPGFSTNAQVERRSDRKASGFVHEPQLYRTLFHTIFLLNEQAEEAERAGRTDVAQALRRAFKQEAGLEVEQGVVLDRLAAACEQAVRAVDARARAILAARRANYPDGKLRAGQQPLPPSPELLALQREREAVVLRYRDRLRAAFGPRAWEEFEQRVLLPFAAGLSAGNTQRDQLAGGGCSGTSNLTTQAGESIVTGSTLISYDDATNLMTAVATTELDYAAQDWYTGDVFCAILDGAGNRLVSSNAYDTDGDGTVSVIVQMAGQAGMTYSVEGRYKLWMDIQDPSGCYVDYWNFPRGFLGSGTIGYYWYYTLFFGNGPICRRLTRGMPLGRTTFPVPPRAYVLSKNPTFTANPITAATDQTHVDVDVEVHTAADVIQPGDLAVLAISVSSKPPGASVTFASGINVNVPLKIADLSTGRFTLSVSKPGQYRFRVSVVDVRRPDGRGGSYSIIDSVRINEGGVVSDPPLTAN
ncbi:hypothetical protein [Chloracidobacterium aggregatum]|uniref:hypothetical protein n=1 Tax=Chloracidobacterium aggregatum TaxID=2851959 RepID=UPI001FE248BB|nr:hypothetical protein [Chloracidobacterium aggregatum]